MDFHGSQCGFCTPGIVMSLYGAVDADATAGRRGDRKGAAGQSLPLHRLCADHQGRQGDVDLWRRGGRSAGGRARSDRGAARGARRRRDASISARARTGSSCRRRSTNSPRSMRPIRARRWSSGATDVGLWVTKFMRDIGPMIYIGHLKELHAIEEGDGGAEARRRRHLHRGDGHDRQALPAARGAVAPDRRRAGAQRRHHRRQHRQRLADRRHAAAADRARREDDAAQGQDAPRGQAQELLHRLWQAGPAAGRVRRERQHSVSVGGRAVRLLQDHQAQGRGHFGAVRRVPGVHQRCRQCRHGADRLWRHGGDAEAGQSGRGGAGRQAVDDGDDRGGAGRVRDRLPADQRHAGLGRVPAAGGQEPAAAVSSRNHRQGRSGSKGRWHEQAWSR